MKRSRFSEHKIINILKEGEAGRSPKEICREYGISQATYYNWKAKYGGMTASSLKRLKDLETENRKLKQMYGDLSLQNVAMKEHSQKKL